MATSVLGAVLAGGDTAVNSSIAAAVAVAVAVVYAFVGAGCLRLQPNDRTRG